MSGLFDKVTSAKLTASAKAWPICVYSLCLIQFYRVNKIGTEANHTIYLTVLRLIQINTIDLIVQYTKRL